MTSYLRTLAALAVGLVPQVEPRLPSAFEPIGDDDVSWGDDWAEEEWGGADGPEGAPRARPPAPEVLVDIESGARPPSPSRPAPDQAPPVSSAGAPSPAPGPRATPAERPLAPAAARDGDGFETAAGSRPPGRPQVRVTVRAARDSGLVVEEPPAPGAPPPSSSRRLPPPGRPSAKGPARPRAVAPVGGRPMPVAAVAGDADSYRRSRPTVHVHIDRVEVRAVPPPVPPPPLAPAPRPSTAPDLEAYLEGRGR